MANLLSQEILEHPHPLIIPFGGCGEFGMNSTLFFYQGHSILVDAGILFAEQYLLGIDGLVPDCLSILREAGHFHAYVMTHGHEDHIGGLPFIWSKLSAPIYATLWTEELIRRKFSKSPKSETEPEIIRVSTEKKYSIGPFEITYFPVNHSLPMTSSLLIEVGGKKIFHTGDFKFDVHATHEPPVDLQQLKKLCSKGVDLLLADSTNAPVPGICGSESKMTAKLEELFRTSTGRVYLTTFSSNLWRIISVLNASHKAHRRVYIAGFGMQSTIETAAKLGLLNVDEELFVSSDQLEFLAPEQSVILISGCQGEYRSALYRLAQDELPKLSIEPGDTVIFSSRIIPGNEKSVSKISNRLFKKQAKIITPYTDANIHVSGHAFADEIHQLFKVVQPKSFLPIHGNFIQQKSNLNIAQHYLRQENHLHIPENGQVLSLQADNSLTVLDHLDIETLYIDGTSKVVLDRTNVKSRLKIGELGGIFFSSTLVHKKHFELDDAQFSYFGVGLPTEDVESFEENLLQHLETQLNESFNSTDEVSFTELSEFVRLAIRAKFFKFLHKKISVTVHLHIGDD